jgi:hypothetical protein
MDAERRCAMCGGSMEERRRRHARYCPGACRAEASRLRRIAAGTTVDGFASVADREARRRRRTGAPRGVSARGMSGHSPRPNMLVSHG